MAKRIAGVFTVGQVAELTGLSKRTIVRQIDKGLLPGYRLPQSGDRRVTALELARYLRKYDLPPGPFLLLHPEHSHLWDHRPGSIVIPPEGGP
jgi:excisionase family DNA binding protein